MLAFVSLLAITGCGPSFHELRLWGRSEALDGNWATARTFYEQAADKSPEHGDNLHDLGVCSIELAHASFDQGNRAAGLREVDRAIRYYTRATQVNPGMQAAIRGRNNALELKGKYEAALDTAEWAATYVGPSARQQVFLAKEYEERGDLDGALLRFRQAVAMEPNNPTAHRELGEFSERTGNPAAAAVSYKQSFTLDPSQEDIAMRLKAMGEDVPEVPEPTQ